MGPNMASLFTLLASAVVFETALSFTIDFELEKSESGIVFPTEYYFRGEVTSLFTGLIQPFQIWYSAENNRSRIDYYDGTTKTYYVAENDEDVGRAYEVFPMTTDTLDSEVICVPEENDGPQKNFLPKTENYTYVGKTSRYGLDTEIWEYKEYDDEVLPLNVYHTLFVYREGDIHLPLRYEVRKYNDWSKSLYAHYINVYKDFGTPNFDDLDVDKVEECNVFSNVEEKFKRFKSLHNKEYGSDEHEFRRTIFEENLRIVEEHNRNNLSYKMAINEFSDLTPDEFGVFTATGFQQPIEGTEPFIYSEEELGDMVKDLPENFDLRSEGYISKIKHQARCGSCWAFTATASIEGALARTNGGRLLDLSEQSLVDCSWGFGNMGCLGGHLETAMKYVMKYGIPTEKDYGLYKSKNGYCHIQNVTDVQHIRGFGRVPVKSVNAMKVALYKYGPVAVAVHVGDKMSKYSSGIFYDPECNESSPNHGMVVVGYGVRDGNLYWILKNSYGEHWGEDGYLLISAKDNNCHVLEHATYPIV
ncbi:unnamed protein product [Leptosia nina]|uniref:Uncharacterized protein n=1 Tax=Leptosia nina TaxID=320188 RepID=A0AAV1J4Y0_9NEOP